MVAENSKATPAASLSLEKSNKLIYDKNRLRKVFWMSSVNDGVNGVLADVIYFSIHWLMP